MIMQSFAEFVIAKHPVEIISALEAKHSRIGIESVSIYGPKANIGICRGVEYRISSICAVVSRLKNIAFELLAVFIRHIIAYVAFAISEHKEGFTLELKTEG